MANKVMTDKEIKKAFAEQKPEYELIGIGEDINLEGCKRIDARKKSNGFRTIFYIKVV